MQFQGKCLNRACGFCADYKPAPSCCRGAPWPPKSLHISNVDIDWALDRPNDPMGRLAWRRIIDAHNALVDWVMAGEERPVAAAWPCELGGGECYCVPLCGTPKPAAPTPDVPWDTENPGRCSECDPSFGCFNGSAPCSKQPAALEPSADRIRMLETALDNDAHHGARVLALATENSELRDRVATLLKERTEDVLVRREQFERAESAEAQLAAVRLELRTDASAHEMIREICGIVFPLTALTGEGSKT